ncbi:hypothetical protein LuPra_04547 [Luteitalea pratensis]|uniref:Uncharacterized protein n=1 Tax=Luteitalea pratensis TaxID=1855912 RepID=A0A143PU02_LUTPR|nr:hypothetical protein [Luteitalea pratensis]AMY11299.1 hypothetical protein LuPra_04547 [Luteitalea pratensis]
MNETDITPSGDPNVHDEEGEAYWAEKDRIATCMFWAQDAAERIKADPVQTQATDAQKAVRTELLHNLAGVVGMTGEELARCVLDVVARRR